MTSEQTENNICKDCGNTLKIYELDNTRGRQVKKCPKCGLYYFFKRNILGKWSLAKVVEPYSPKESNEATTRKTTPLSKNVFIVHGRDYKPMEELKTMLSEFGLNPIVLHEQPSGSRTIVEKLEKYSDVGYAFVILTPDDMGVFADEIMMDKLLPTIMKPRARQNVVLEFGYFIGKLGRDRVCCLYKGEVVVPSDMHGIVYIPFKESVKECCDKIIKELKAVGYEIKI